MTAPKRIQLRRTKGWRMPENTVKVARPTEWGNPYRVGDTNDVTGLVILDTAEAVDLYQAHIEMAAAVRPELYNEWVLAVRRELAGKNLACFCPLDQPCHADVLLELANRDES